MTALTRADLILLLVAAIWGASFTVIKDAYREIPAIPFVGMRFLLVAVSMVPFLLWHWRRLPRTRSAWIGAWTIGVLGVAGYQILFSLGLQYTTASKSTLLMATSPLFTAIVAALLGIERPGRLAGSLGYILWYRNVPRIGAVRGSLYEFVIPVIGVLCAMVVLGERLTLGQTVGALLVLIGVVVARGWLTVFLRHPARKLPSTR